MLARAMAKTENPVDAKLLAAFDTMIATIPGVERRGAAMPYTSVNGNMYAMISKAGVIGLRLGKDDLAAFVAAGAGPFEGTPGFVNKDYAAVPTAMLGDAAALQFWFARSHALAIGLKPKKTTR